MEVVKEGSEGEGWQEMDAECWGLLSGVDGGMRAALVSWGRWWRVHTHRLSALTHPPR